MAFVLIKNETMIDISAIGRDLRLIKERSPLVHNITNFVVMNNTANALLAIGASPVMAHAIEEVEEMAGIASSMVLNIGTLEPRWVDAMVLAGKIALKRNIPIVFDPVGVGATSYRSEVCKQIISECKPSIIRGNASEIIALCNENVKTKGVDSTESSDSALSWAMQLAREVNAVVVISGQTDYITDGELVEMIYNGSTMMEKVTGMGCTATAVLGAFAAVNPSMFDAAIHGMAVMGIAGEIAAVRSKGNGSLQVNFLDELYAMDEEVLCRTFRQ